MFHNNLLYNILFAHQLFTLETYLLPGYFILASSKSTSLVNNAFKYSKTSFSVCPVTFVHIDLIHLSFNPKNRLKFEGYKKWQSTFSQGEDPVKPAEEKIDTKTPAEIIGEAFKNLIETLGSELLDLIIQKKPAQFEKFVLELLNKMGYGGAEEKNIEVVGKSGDNGIEESFTRIS